MSGAFPRKRKRLVVEFVDENGSKRTAFTRDVSMSGFFVISDTNPPVGKPATLNVHLPRGTVVALTGTVVRHGISSSARAGTVSTGFAFALAEYSEEYSRLVAFL